MAKVTVQIGGVGKVELPDSFLQLSPDQQNAQIEEIAKSAGAAVGHSAPNAESQVANLSPNSVFNALTQQESSGEAGVLGPPTQWGRAVGKTQTLPDTAKEMASKLGLPWRPDLLSGKTPEAAKYQTILGRAYFDEGLHKYGGDIRQALRYYYGGPDERQWGPKTEQYVHDVLARVPGASDAPTPAASSLQIGDSSGFPPLPNTPTDNAPPAAASADIPQFSPEQKAQILAYLPKAKSGADLQAFAQKLAGDKHITIGDADQVVDYIRKGGDPSHLAWAAPEVQPPAPSPDEDPKHVAAVAGRGAVQGLVDLPKAAAQGTANLFGGVGLGSLVSPLIDKVGDTAVEGLLGKAGTPQTALDRYLSSGAEGVTASLGGGGLETGAADLAKMGLGAGLGSQAAEDLGLPPWLGALVGGGGLSPTVLERVPKTKARFVRAVRDNPLGPELVEVARDYKTMAGQVNPRGAAPKGRQPLSVEEINAVGDRGLKGMRGKIAKMPIPETDKAILRDALDHAVDIPLERTPDMGPDQIALSDLPDTVEGRAVKAAIRRAKAGDMLSARYGGEKLGPLGKLYNLGVNALPLPYGKGVLKLKGGDINKSRMDAAGKAIKRNRLYEKAGNQLGPSEYGPALSALNEKVSRQASIVDAAKAAKAAEAARKAALNAQVRSGNDVITRKVERNIVRPKDGYRGLIYAQTGVTQPVQDQALLYMVKRGEIPADEMSRLLADPASLMRGKSKAGLKIMDRIGELADQGIIKRDPEWKGPPKELPQGVARWLDANGDPIRSMGAYAGGIAKNIVREMEEGMNLDSVADAEPVTKPKTTKKKRKKQGAE